ncbi:TPA: DNA-binding protein [Candidatus Poribacteria bacterium]|nr:DNA-binding protein [Candidatus Poribacteria bacterium]
MDIEDRLYKIEALLEKLLKLRRQTVVSPWLTADDAAEYLSINPSILRRKAKAGKIKFYRHPGTRKMWFHVQDLDAYVRGGCYENPKTNETECESEGEKEINKGAGQNLLFLYPKQGRVEMRNVREHR